MISAVTAEDIEAALEYPEQLLRDCDAADSEEHLLDFIKFTWRELEPEEPLVTGWALEAICEHLEGVHRGEIRKLLMNVPPGFMKSLATNVFFPAWEWGPRNQPWQKFIHASYAQHLMLRDNLRFRTLIESPTYQAYWGTRFRAWDSDKTEAGRKIQPIEWGDYWGPRFKLDPRQATKIKIANSGQGYKHAISTGSGTGDRGSRVIVDDPHSVKDSDSDAKRESQVRWFAETMPTRVLNKRSARIVIMQRVNEADISGHILEHLSGWEVLCIPMEFEKDHPITTTRRSWSGWRGDPRKKEGELAWPERFDLEMVEELKEQLRSHGGTYAEVGQLQQRPSPRVGGLFHADDFQIIDERPDDIIFEVRAYDLAGSKRKTSPYTVGVRMGITSDGRVIVSDVERDRLTPHGVKKLLRQLAEADGPIVEISIPQDPGQAGMAQVHDFVRSLHGYTVHYSPESGEKVVRARPFAAQCEARNVYLVKAPWNRPYTREHGGFPSGKFKDQVDASSRAYGHLVEFFAICDVAEGPRVLNAPTTKGGTLDARSTLRSDP